VGILSGLLGEDALTEPLDQLFEQIPQLAPYAHSMALISTVIVITYFYVVVGELVPKRLALHKPESIAIIISRPMNALAQLAGPIVWLLASSSNLVLRLFGAHRPPETTVSNEEIRLLMELGAESGVFHAAERDLVSNVLKLDEQLVGAVMTPRQQIFTINLDDDPETLRARLAECPYVRAVVCRGDLENVVGVLYMSDLLQAALAGEALDIAKLLKPPLYVPDFMTLPYLLEHFQQQRANFALIVDEYGDIHGLVTLSDVLKAIVGQLPDSGHGYDVEFAQRADGSWLVDGGVSIKRLKSVIGMHGDFPGEIDNAYQTLGGFILFQLEKIPAIADRFEYESWSFEIVDIDGRRIDKVLISATSGYMLEKVS
jgi:putative hemolysin